MHSWCRAVVVDGLVFTSIVLISLITAPIKAASIRYERIRSFGTSEADGASPRGRLFRASDGRLYGTAQHGGILSAGTVFGMNRDGSGFAVLHSFDAARMDGIYPAGGVIEASDGVLYGTTSGGGQTGAGTVFRIAKDGTDYRILHDMGVVDGLGPIARLMEGSDGLLYGTTPEGGSVFSGPGLVFRIDKEGMNYEVLHRFQSGSTSYYTLGGVTECSDGKLYGVTFGESGGQSVYRLNKDGSGFEVVHAFLGEWFPVGEAIEAPDGTLRGILGGMGHVFRVNKDGTELVLIHSFGLSLHDGTTPTGDLSLGEDGVLYGTTSAGGSNGFGTVFRMDLDGTDYAVLHSFDSSRTNGWAPMASLLEGRDGFLYGSTSPDNNGSGGTLFKLQRDGSAYTHLHGFPVGNGSGPRGSLIQGRDGALYGTTYQVTPDGVPVAFKINTDGTGYRELTTLAGHRGFVGSLLETSAGTLFGTLLSGQLNLLNGAVLQVPTDGGDYSTVQAFFFEFGEGNQVAAPLIEASDQKVYGTTVGGGTQGAGRLFVMNRDGSGYTLLRSFRPSASGEPRHPLGALLEARDGWLYGTALAGGSADAGAVFRVSKDGTTFQNVRSFGASGNDGRLPIAGLMEASDGAFYGTTAEGGITNSGTIFRLIADPNGTYMVIHRFGSIEQDGRTPVANVVEGWDGSLYGTCSAGGEFGNGTVFRLDKAGGQYEILHNFGDGPDDGQKIRSGLTLARDGALYGTTWGGGAFGFGTMFRLAPTAALQIDRPYQLSLSGPAGLRWRIEVTTDLGEPASWQTLTNVVSGNAPVPINAPEAEFAQRFFRAILTR